jgi:RHS repeat-associated protein
MSGRTYDIQSRYTFNGTEQDPETGYQDYGMRIYDKRLGKFLSVDPITKK